ncbi:MAG: hypothetical protein ACK5XP_00645, partial [Sphingobacteriia bacterium]
IQKYVEDPIADELLNVNVAESDTITVDLGSEDEIKITHAKSGTAKKKKGGSGEKSGEKKEESK